jgi:hypothetical protein
MKKDKSDRLECSNCHCDLETSKGYSGIFKVVEGVIAPDTFIGYLCSDCEKLKDN